MQQHNIGLAVLIGALAIPVIAGAAGRVYQSNNEPRAKEAAAQTKAPTNQDPTAMEDEVKANAQQEVKELEAKTDEQKAELDAKAREKKEALESHLNDAQSRLDSAQEPAKAAY